MLQGADGVWVNVSCELGKKCVLVVCGVRVFRVSAGFLPVLYVRYGRRSSDGCMFLWVTLSCRPVRFCLCPSLFWDKVHTRSGWGEM